MVVNKERHYEYRTYHIPAGKYKTSPGIKSIIIYYFAPNDEEEKDDNNDDGGTKSKCGFDKRAGFKWSFGRTEL